jgi:hypothetical protein
MATFPRITLANFLENFFDLDSNPQVKTLLVMLMLGIGLWLMSLQRLPTRAEARAAARKSAGRGIVVRKAWTSRHGFSLSVMSEGRLVQDAFWEYYYPPAVATDTAAPLSNEDSHRLALATCAQLGDSLIKQPESLFVQVKRGTTTRTFQYRNPYP